MQSNNHKVIELNFPSSNLSKPGPFLEGSTRNRESEDSRPCSDSRKHGRSKSASERDMYASSGANGVYAPSVSTMANTGSNPLHEPPAYIKKNASSNQRTSLERDEKSMRMVLERAMGRASSTLSPGHRHFAAQTKELIAEIELLEEEVANREQHVLSLYRSIFEHSLSRASSEQNSGVSSPAHIKQPPRKHPSVISNAFCSSKNIALRPWHALVTINDLSRKTSKKDQASQFAESDSFPSATNCSSQSKTHAKDSTTDKSPTQRTLKDHLYQCPSKLSEEMVKCMASVYFWLCSSVTSTNPDKRRSPIPSRSSSTKVIIPRNIMSEDRAWSCKSMVEISWISTDKRRFSQASYAINNYRLLVEQLERVTLSQMEDNAKLAFWVNVYNSLVMHAYLAYGVPANSLRRLALFHKSAYNIGGHIISANTIEHSIFCFQTPRSGRWLETIISTALRKKSAEDRQNITSSRFKLSKSEPLLCFALCTGSLSDPVLKVYTASNVKEEIEAAKREFMQSNVVVKKLKKVYLPKVIERFGKESGLSSEEVMRWVMENVDKKLQESIQKCIEGKPNYKKVIEWLPYSSRFRYVFSEDLMEKPWWM
ncbi:PREDICTED: uncharacterized protein LOC104798362 isoform X2 [Tarenaya hassleriana]|uniref:uncharacterized protein LOC104798362 isoform X2 n=1 Tax=Tarenaya hassleriana TaxID=28532 RepID=UPI00053C26D6|nr:PREDICTED: uncharacterized protein LOC104798362 isoform X2 [Tarenaya hassleriana]